MVSFPSERLTSYHFMDNENELPQEETVVEEGTVEETPIEPQEQPKEETVVLTKADFNKLNRKAIAYEATKNKAAIISPDNSINTIDQIKLGKKLVDYSDDELDFVVDYAKSKKPEDVLKALENPFVQMGIKANREKVEKEKLTLKPTGTQSETEANRSPEERLQLAQTEEEKQTILEEMGLYSEPRRRPDAFNVRI